MNELSKRRAGAVGQVQWGACSGARAVGQLQWGWGDRSGVRATHCVPLYQLARTGERNPTARSHAEVSTTFAIQC